MDIRRVLAGTITWFLGFLPVVLQHGLLSHAAAHEEKRMHTYHNMVKDFTDLPFITWVYLILMTVVGAALVLPELRRAAKGRGND